MLGQGSSITSELSQEIINWLKKSIATEHVKILEIRPLAGSTSSLIYNILFQAEKNNKQEAVLRLFDNEEWLKNEPDIALHEAAALNLAFKNKLNSPKLIAIDPHGEQCAHPAILMSKLHGEVILKPQDNQVWLKGLAHNLSYIHLVEPQNYTWKYFTYNNSLQVPHWTEHQEGWGRLLNHIKTNKPTFKQCFIHRDYHPTNILWQNGKVSGTVDWVNACIGPAGVDIGHLRINLVMLIGTQAADQFLQFYQEHASQDFIYDPYWDIVSLFDIEIDNLKLYPGWPAFGVNNLTEKLIRKRVDEYAKDLLKKI